METSSPWRVGVVTTLFLFHCTDEKTDSLMSCVLESVGLFPEVRDLQHVQVFSESPTQFLLEYSGLSSC